MMAADLHINPIKTESPDLKLSHNLINIMFILGGPGSGKGSVCSLILSDPEFQHLFCHISIGDVLREEIARGGENGPVIQQCMKDGKLLPWDMILRYLKQGIDAEIDKTGRKWVLLDGFPRMLSQGRSFEQIANYRCHGAILLDCSQAEMLRRTSKRGQSGHRVDDNRDTVLKRIEGYLAETMPVVEHYRTQGSLINVSSEGTAEQTYANLRPLLKNKLETTQHLATF